MTKLSEEFAHLLRTQAPKSDLDRFCNNNGEEIYRILRANGEVERLRAEREKEITDLGKRVTAQAEDLSRHSYIIADLNATIARQSAALGTAREALKPFVDAFNQSTDWAEVMDLLGDEQFQTARAAVRAIDEVMK